MLKRLNYPEKTATYYDKLKIQVPSLLIKKIPISIPTPANRFYLLQ